MNDKVYTIAEDLSKLDSVMLRSEQILDRLWNYVETLADSDRSSEIYALFTTIAAAITRNAIRKQ